MHRGLRVVLRPHADRRRHVRKHRLYGIALLLLAIALAGCGGGGSSGSPTIAIQPAGQYRLTTHVNGPPAANRPATITYSITQPNGRNLTKFKRGAGPHTGVHVIYVRDDLGAIVHHHPHIAANGTFTDTVDFPLGGPYRVVIDVYPQQSTPQPNFQLFTRVKVKGKYTPEKLPAPVSSETVDGYRFALHGVPRLRAIQAAFLSFTVTSPDGAPAQFTPVVRRARARDLLPEGIARLLPHARVRAGCGELHEPARRREGDGDVDDAREADGRRARARGRNVAPVSAMPRQGTRADRTVHVAGPMRRMLVAGAVAADGARAARGGVRARCAPAHDPVGERDPQHAAAAGIARLLGGGRAPLRDRLGDRRGRALGDGWTTDALAGERRPARRAAASVCRRVGISSSGG